MSELLCNPGVLFLVQLPGLPLFNMHSVEDVQSLGFDGVSVLLDEFPGALQLLHHGPPRGSHQATRKLFATIHLHALGCHRTQGRGVVSVTTNLQNLSSSNLKP